MRRRILLAALALLAAAAAPLLAEPRGGGGGAARSGRAVETSFGADGASLALFFSAPAGRLALGVRCGLGFEWSDFRMDDPAATVAARYALLASRRWAWLAGVEAGVAAIDAGYDRFALPFVGASTGASFRFGDRLAAAIEAGGRFGRRDLRSEAALAFLDVRYRETVFIDPLILRACLSLAW